MNGNTKTNMKAIELNANEIGRIQVILSDYLNGRETGHIELDKEFVMDNKTFVTIWIDGYYSKDESFRYGQMREDVEFNCETFCVNTDIEVDGDWDIFNHYQDSSLLSFSESETFDHLGNGKFI